MSSEAILRFENISKNINRTEILKMAAVRLLY